MNNIMNCWVFLGLLLTTVSGLSFDVTDIDSVCAAAKAIADGEWNYYEGLTYGGTVGEFVPPYYWWNAGEAFGGLITYLKFCDPTNTTLEKILVDGMFAQAGADYNYIPSNQSLVEGNDDQGIWGMTIMEAAERNITQPSDDHSWISLSQAIYNTMNARWDTTTCGGGLRWQIFTWNSGYDYKNTISNGLLFHMAARLARYLDNDTYVETAEKVWDWIGDVGFYSANDSSHIIIHDGAKVTDNCTEVTDIMWSYTYGVFIAGCAYLYDYTNDEKWKTRTVDLVNTAQGYFQIDGIMAETHCQAAKRCNNDQRTFRCLLSRCLGIATVLVPDTQDLLEDYLSKSAAGAAQSCSGGSDGVTCGQDWAYSGWDGVYGLGEQMSALEVILATIQTKVDEPLSVTTGGNNNSDSNAGLDSQDATNKNEIKVTGKDKAGAGVLTAVVLGVILGGGVWMIF